ncbi:MAG TPA: AEC family transporter [Verrucomicrobiae bacterium]
MSEFQTVLGAVLPVFGIIGAGLFLRKLNWLTEEADQSLLRVNINLLMPCLILDSTLGNPALAQWGNLLLGPLVGFSTVALGMALAGLARPLHGLREPRAARTFAVSVGIYNYGYVPIPLALLLFDKPTVGVLMVLMVGAETALWTLGVMGLTGHRPGKDWRKIVNAPLVAIALALALNTLGWSAILPQALLTGIHWLGQCAIPIALILIGAVVADHVHEFHSRSGWRVMGTAVLLRMGLLPLAFLLLARYLPASTELKRVIVIEAAMPAAVFPIVMARHYGGDAATALRVVFSTSVVGLITIPLWIRFGLRFAGF